MAINTYDDFVKSQNTKNNNSNGGGNQNRTFVNFFKLQAGRSAIVRFNIKSIESMTGKFALVHHAKYIPGTNNKFDGLTNFLSGIQCLEENCPFCNAIRDGNDKIEVAKNKFFVEMMVSYLNQDGTYTQAAPCVWEKPALFSSEIASKLNVYKDLTKVKFIITRTGAGLDTKYSIDLAPNEVYPDTLCPNDFSAFNNFDISKHSYYVKTASEMNTYLSTGSFPSTKKEPIKQQSAAPAPTPVEVEVPRTEVFEKPQPQPILQATPQPQAQPTFSWANQQPEPQNTPNAAPSNDAFKWFGQN